MIKLKAEHYLLLKHCDIIIIIIVVKLIAINKELLQGGEIDDVPQKYVLDEFSPLRVSHGASPHQVEDEVSQIGTHSYYH